MHLRPYLQAAFLFLNLHLRVVIRVAAVVFQFLQAFAVFGILRDAERLFASRTRHLEVERQNLRLVHTEADLIVRHELDFIGRDAQGSVAVEEVVHLRAVAGAVVYLHHGQVRCLAFQDVAAGDDSVAHLAEVLGARSCLTLGILTERILCGGHDTLGIEFLYEASVAVDVAANDVAAVGADLAAIAFGSHELPQTSRVHTVFVVLQHTRLLVEGRFLDERFDRQGTGEEREEHQCQVAVECHVLLLRHAVVGEEGTHIGCGTELTATEYGEVFGQSVGDARHLQESVLLADAECVTLAFLVGSEEDVEVGRRFLHLRHAEAFQTLVAFERPAHMVEDVLHMGVVLVGCTDAVECEVGTHGIERIAAKHHVGQFDVLVGNVHLYGAALAVLVGFLYRLLGDKRLVGAHLGHGFLGKLALHYETGSHVGHDRSTHGVGIQSGTEEEEAAALAALALRARPFGLHHLAPLLRVALLVRCGAEGGEDREQRVRFAATTHLQLVVPEALGGVRFHFVQSQLAVDALYIEVRCLDVLAEACPEGVLEHGHSVLLKGDALARCGFLVQTLHAAAQSLQPLYAEVGGGLYGYLLLCIDQGTHAVAVLIGEPRRVDAAHLHNGFHDAAAVLGCVGQSHEPCSEGNGPVAHLVGSRFGHFPQRRGIQSALSVSVAHPQDALLVLVPRREV